MIIAVDFDGTIVDHRYPQIGADVPGAFRWMKIFQEHGAKLILWTCRSGPELEAAVEHCRRNGIEFWGTNEKPGQESWSSSPKAHANVYIDDAAFGCPLHTNPRMGGRPYVDWDAVGPVVLDQLKPKQEAAA